MFTAKVPIQMLRSNCNVLFGTADIYMAATSLYSNRLYWFSSFLYCGKSSHLAGPSTETWPPRSFVEAVESRKNTPLFKWANYYDKAWVHWWWEDNLLVSKWLRSQPSHWSLRVNLTWLPLSRSSFLSSPWLNKQKQHIKYTFGLFS